MRGSVMTSRPGIKDGDSEVNSENEECSFMCGHWMKEESNGITGAWWENLVNMVGIRDWLWRFHIDWEAIMESDVVGLMWWAGQWLLVDNKGRWSVWSVDLHSWQLRWELKEWSWATVGRINAHFVGFVGDGMTCPAESGQHSVWFNNWGKWKAMCVDIWFDGRCMGFDEPALDANLVSSIYFSFSSFSIHWMLLEISWLETLLFRS